MASGVEVTLTPIYGAQGGSALCSLLTIDKTRILLDCGWTDSFDPAILEPLRAIAPTIDIVLLSHPDLEHVGALPLLLSKWRCPAHVYSTLPVNRMGQMFLYDAYLSRTAADANFSAFSLDDVDAAFKLVNFPGGKNDLLRYSEERTTKGVTFAPLPAGRMLGGSLWRITKGPESILYAVGFNHRTERHLGKASALNLAALQRRPTVMITDALNGLTIHPVPAPAASGLTGALGAAPATATAAALLGKDAAAAAAAAAAAPEKKASARDATDKELVDTILATLRGGGNVLLPTDTAGRCLELLLRLEAAWPEVLDPAQGEIDFPIVFLNHVSSDEGRDCESRGSRLVFFVVRQDRVRVVACYAISINSKTRSITRCHVLYLDSRDTMNP